MRKSAVLLSVTVSDIYPTSGSCYRSSLLISETALLHYYGLLLTVLVSLWTLGVAS